MVQKYEQSAEPVSLDGHVIAPYLFLKTYVLNKVMKPPY